MPLSEWNSILYAGIHVLVVVIFSLLLSIACGLSKNIWHIKHFQHLKLTLLLLANIQHLEEFLIAPVWYVFQTIAIVCPQIYETFIESNCCMSTSGLKLCHQLRVLWSFSGANLLNTWWTSRAKLADALYGIVFWNMLTSFLGSTVPSTTAC